MTSRDHTEPTPQNRERFDLTDLIAPPAWTDDALCREVDPDLFFPTHDTEGSGNTRAAKRICARCSVTTECLALALAYESGTYSGISMTYVAQGVWGGLSPNERSQILSERRSA